MAQLRDEAVLVERAQRSFLLDVDDHRAQIVVRGRVLQGRGPMLALQQQLHSTEAALNLADPSEQALIGLQKWIVSGSSASTFAGDTRESPQS